MLHIIAQTSRKREYSRKWGRMDKALSQDTRQSGEVGTGSNERDHLTQLGRALSHTQRLAGIGSLSASTAHELTNPLHIITSSCNNLLYALQDDSADQELLIYYASLIERSAFHIAQIVKVLQDYARLDEPEMVVTDVSMIVRDSLALVENQFRNQANIQIEVDIGDYLGSVVCDHNRITQVLVNLLTNARDAMKPEGGIIRLRTWSTLSKANGRANKESGDVDAPGQFAFSVTDSGHGIQAEIMGEIFRPFFSTRSNEHGVGLGLFVAKGIVNQHNGRIWAENNAAPAKGATFTVVLPLRPPF
jgi:signal transduction histidine kinase